jgi:pimeloyl-ACP methyl ester carboxylesterase
MDLRGFNLSDAPKGLENYATEHLVDDVAAVIANEERDSAVVVGHDWGGVTAWAFAQAKPELTERVVVVNVPHPQAMSTDMKRSGSAQTGAFAYTRDFRQAISLPDGGSDDLVAEVDAGPSGVDLLDFDLGESGRAQHVGGGPVDLATVEHPAVGTLQ